MLTTIARCFLLAATVATTAELATWAPPDAPADWYFDVIATVALALTIVLTVILALEFIVKACRAVWRGLRRVRSSPPTRLANQKALAESVGRTAGVGGTVGRSVGDTGDGMVAKTALADTVGKPWATLGNPGRPFDPPRNFPAIKSSAIRLACQRNAACTTNNRRRFVEPPEVASAFAASMRAQPDVGRRIGVDEVWTAALAFCRRSETVPPTRVAFLRELAKVPGVRRRAGDRINIDGASKKTTTYAFRAIAERPALVIARRQAVDKSA